MSTFYLTMFNCSWLFAFCVMFGYTVCAVWRWMHWTNVWWSLCQVTLAKIHHATWCHYLTTIAVMLPTFRWNAATKLKHSQVHWRQWLELHWLQPALVNSSVCGLVDKSRLWIASLYNSGRLCPLACSSCLWHSLEPWFPHALCPAYRCIVVMYVLLLAWQRVIRQRACQAMHCALCHHRHRM